MEDLVKKINDNHKFLSLLSEQFPTISAVSAEIINLRAILDLPKGTEHFLSDLHGEADAFLHILNNCSGVIREKVDLVFGHTIGAPDRAALATLIYYPRRKLANIKKTVPAEHLDDWYRITLHRLIEIVRIVSMKYTRSKVRKALPSDFAYIIDELLHTNYDAVNKELYYDKIISTIIEVGRADAFIEAISEVIKRLAVDHLHIVGDIYDRGPRADIIMDSLRAHHRVDVQWGNHDILWMGAAAGSPACIANVLNISLQYNNLDVIESGYAINLRPLTTFAQETYAQDDCAPFFPRLLDEAGGYDPKHLALVAKIHKAIVVIQFKLEGQLIRRNPDFEMESRLLLDKIDYEHQTITIDGKKYPVRDCNFPTVDPKDPYRLTDEEAELVSRLVYNFTHSGKLQWHIRFLYAQGGLYKCYNDNLLFHGCIPLEEDGSFTTIRLEGKELSGKSLMDYADKMARQAYFAPEGSPAREHGLDFMWYLWCGKHSPLFGRSRMTTFERYLIEDKSTWTEGKDPYYELNNDPAIAARIIQEFGLDPERAHIINGHVPVKYKDGESPVKAGGKVIVIDGGFCRAYQPTTGLAGYTLIYNSYGLRIVSHAPFASTRQAIEKDEDILSTSTFFETMAERKKVADTDEGRRIAGEIDDLRLLLEAYRLGYIKEREKK